ncbi:hypothetical protein HRI_002544300 [Hibiscus trionum]|uniref:Uncharacterized protein n=1 Tax=Hibiscus trionum TaxID=183268 RepID=A0A9W7I734_HIBTR|nr:hypothetical protein HRI_002544300 [Hibiscus trionum]
MDFHCLSRKELQFLCKKNKIPANITNVAMADALKALELVEGLEEIQNQSQSPEKTVNKEILGTVTRTSTRRKPSKDELQSTQSTIRTRRTATKTMGVEEENKNLNVPEIDVKDLMKSDMLETPLPSGRRRPGVGSTRTKANAQKEGSMQRAYGTRQSVRLLEKGMAGLCIKESEKKPVKVDEIVECEDGSNNGQSGATLELPLARNLSASLEDERELKNDVEENRKRVDVESDETDEKLMPEDGSYNGESNEKTDEPEGEDKVADEVDGIIEPKGSDGIAVPEYSNLNEVDDVAVSNDADEIKNLNEKSEADETNHVADETNNEYEELVVDETKSIEVDVPEEVVDDVTILPKAEEHADGGVSQNVSVVPVEGHMDSSSAEKENESNDDDTGSDCESLAEEHDDVQSVPKLPAEGHMDYSAKKENEESDVVSFLDDSNIDDDEGSDSKSLADELQEEDSCEQKGGGIPTDTYSSEGMYEESDDDDDDDSTGNEESDDDDRTGNEESDDDDSTGNEESDEEAFLGNSDIDPMTNMVNANVTEAETTPVSSFHNAPQSVVDGTAQKMVNCGGSEAVIDVCVKPADESAETAPVSNSESSNKIQTAMEKVTQVSDNIDKENILEKQREMKKLEDLSLRELRKMNKMFKKLGIAEKMKNKEDNKPSGKSRTALQMLPQNAMKSEDGNQD